MPNPTAKNKTSGAPVQRAAREVAPSDMQPRAAASPRSSESPRESEQRLIRSMTGFAQSRADYDGWQLRVNVRSVNHRFLDLRMRLPEGFEVFETAIRQLVRDRVRRGHVEVTLHADATGVPQVQVNRETAAAYMRAIDELRREFGISAEPDLVALLRLPGVVAGHAGSTPESALAAGVAPNAASNAASPAALSGAPALDSAINPALDPTVDAVNDQRRLELLGTQVAACVKEALERLQQMREAEGRSLAAEIQQLLTSIGEKAAQVHVLTERSRPAYALRLRSRLEELLGQGAAAVPVDPARLAQEAALLAERADVSEELARLRSHVAQFGELIEGGGEVGKKLDFLLQEMQREANTLLSKTPALGEEALAVTELGLQIKSEIEKIREQVQNVE